MLSRFLKYSRFIFRYVHPKGPPLAYVGGVYGARNLGDEAIRQAASILFSKCTILEYPRKLPTARAATKFLRVPNGLLAGGTLINQRSIWFDLASLYVPAFNNFIIFGTGVAHPDFWGDQRNAWKPLLSKCAYIGVRGPLSAQLLADIGIFNADVIGDPALIFAPPAWRDIAPSTSQTLGLNIGWDRANQYGTEQSIFDEIALLATLAKDSGWNVKWFVISPTDCIPTIRIAKLSGTGSDIHFIYNDPSEFIRRVNHCNVFIGTRLHSAVLSACAYVPTIMLEYRPKCRDFMQSINQEDHTIRTDMLSAKSIFEQACHLSLNRTRYSQELFHSIKPLRERQIVKALQLQSSMLSSFHS